jgi:hypothetical protein
MVVVMGIAYGDSHTLKRDSSDGEGLNTCCLIENLQKLYVKQCRGAEQKPIQN